MKITFTFCLILMIFGTGVFRTMAQGLVIQSLDGTEDIRLLCTLQNFTFSNGNLLLSGISGSTDSYSISTIRRIYFVNVPTAIENNTTDNNTGTVSLFPNPASTTITLQNLPGEDQVDVAIYRMDGVTIMRTQISADDNSIDISKLPGGLYILTVNGQALRFIRQ
jgi:hypothetical protein